MRFNTKGVLVADSEDYALPLNTMDAQEVEGHGKRLTVFRCLVDGTDGRQLYALAIDTDRPMPDKIAAAKYVQQKAEGSDARVVSV